MVKNFKNFKLYMVLYYSKLEKLVLYELLSSKISLFIFVTIYIFDC